MVFRNDQHAYITMVFGVEFVEPGEVHSDAQIHIAAVKIPGLTFKSC